MCCHTPSVPIHQSHAKISHMFQFLFAPSWQLIGIEAIQLNLVTVQVQGQSMTTGSYFTDIMQGNGFPWCFLVPIPSVCALSQWLALTWWPARRGWWTWTHNEALSQEAVASIPPAGRSRTVFHLRRQLQQFFPSKPVYFLWAFHQCPWLVPQSYIKFIHSFHFDLPVVHRYPSLPVIKAASEHHFSSTILPSEYSRHSFLLWRSWLGYVFI